MPITHAFVSAKPASADATKVDGPKWNDDHVISGITDQRLTKVVGGSLVQTDAYYDPPGERIVIPHRLHVSCDLASPAVGGDDPVVSIITSGTALTAHDGGLQSFCTQEYDTDANPSCIAQGVLAANEATKTGAGSLINSAFAASASGGTENYSFNGTSGTLRNNEDAVIGIALTVGSGAAANPGECVLHVDLLIDNVQTVSLGNNVTNFVVPGDASTSPCIAIGASATGAAQINTKNTVAGNPDAGVQVLLDTTVNANARGGFTAYRGAGGGSGGAKQMGICYAGSADVFIIGAVADDVCIFNTAPSKRMLFSSDGSGFTVGAALDGAGLFVAKALMTGDPGAGTGAKWTRGTNSPEGVVTGNKGDLFSRTDGGAATCLYVKETTGGNTGWVAK